MVIYTDYITVDLYNQLKSMGYLVIVTDKSHPKCVLTSNKKGV